MKSVAGCLSAWSLSVLIWLALPVAAEAEDSWIGTTPTAHGMTLVGKAAADIVYSPDDAAVVGIAANDLAADIGRVTGKAPVVTAHSDARQQVWIGTLGHSAVIDAVAAQIDVARLKECWECYVIATVPNPAPGIDAALVIIGSDRRGTAYGAFEVSRAIGVSPWVWWADVAPAHKNVLYVAAGTHRFGPPSVKYRGIFINDEDWGLEPWAAKTFDPQTGNLGPKTYGRVFDLLLRLRANTLWPAMHEVSTPFNATPENAALADRYGIVMGSSHAEPMLRNNVGEWKDKPEQFNYAINSEGVQAYWRERLKSNGRYENIYTLGMRGIHDSGIVGADTLEGRQTLLNRILTDQRQMLKEEVGAPETLPQIFVPYKEVLDIYRAGLDLPDDVTIVWPDDNFGYIRHFPDAAEQKRSGGSGVYYHLSYLGAPLSYIWLSTTPPSLIREEMTRAYDSGVRQFWIANAGDIKPAEISLSYFLDLAWDVEGVRKENQREWLERFARQTFGSGQAGAIGGIWDDYYRLNFVRRPEHLQWNLPKEASKASPLSGADIDARVADFVHLRQRANDVAPRISPAQRDAYFELVDYPTQASALANQRYFAFECVAVPQKACRSDETAAVLDGKLKALSTQYNHVAGGKWAGLMNEEPADDQWKSFRITRRDWTRDAPGELAVPAPVTAIPLTLLPSEGWNNVPDLGMQADAITSPLRAIAQAADQGWQLRVSILPSFPADNADGWGIEVQIDDGPRLPLIFSRGPQDKVWAQGVLENRLTAIMFIPPATHDRTVKIHTKQAGLIVRGLDMLKN